MELAVRLAAVAVLGWVIWQLFQPRYVFMVRVRGGRPRTGRGRVTPEMLDEVRTVCAEHGIVHGTVAGILRGPRVALVFTGFPPSAQQQLRNWWTASGSGRAR